MSSMFGVPVVARVGRSLPRMQPGSGRRILDKILISHFFSGEFAGADQWAIFGYPLPAAQPCRSSRGRQRLNRPSPMAMI